MLILSDDPRFDKPGDTRELANESEHAVPSRYASRLITTVHVSYCPRLLQQGRCSRIPKPPLTEYLIRHYGCYGPGSEVNLLREYESRVSGCSLPNANRERTLSTIRLLRAKTRENRDQSLSITPAISGLLQYSQYKTSQGSRKPDRSLACTKHLYLTLPAINQAFILIETHCSSPFHDLADPLI